MITHFTITKSKEILIGKHKGKVHTSIWKNYSFGVWLLLNSKIAEDKFIDVPETGKRKKDRRIHREKMPRLLVKNLLIKTTLVDISHNEDDEVSEKSLKELMSLKPKIVSAFLQPILDLSEVLEDEEEQMERECSVLFSPKSNGVEDPCRALQLHSIMGGFWNEYGLNVFDLNKLPVEDGVRLKEILRMKASTQSLHNKPKKSSIKKSRGR